MTSYTNTFTGAPIQVTPTSYRDATIAVDTTLSWPENNEDNANVAADTLEVTASAASLSLIMPPADQVSNGKACLIRNIGANTFTVKDSAGGTIQSIAAGQVFWVYVTDNSTAAGTWSAFQFGTGTSAANAADLDGNGLIAIGSLLNVAFPVSAFNSNFTLTTNYRGTVANWTGGAGTFSFDPVATLGNNWFIIIKNSGSGALVLDPASTELIDGTSTISLNAGESCIVACTGSALLSFCKNSTVSISFTRLVKSVAGGTDVTLTSGEAGYDIQEYTGLLTANINVIVPTAVSRWWVYNNTTGAFNLTVKTSAGTGIAVAQGTRQILHCDGTNVVKSVDSGSGTVTSIATGTGLTGGPITSSGTVSLANTAVAAGSYGSATQTSSFTVDAQGRIVPAANVSINLGTTAVSGGGTGRTSLTVNNVLLGDGTNPVAFVAPGASGESLISNGTTWQSGVAKNTLLGVQRFTSTATYTPTSGTNKVFVQICGAGGSGAKSNNALQFGSGGSGAYAEKLITSAFSGVTVTIGAGGAGQSTANTVGNAGGSSSFGAIITCTGGLAGSASPNATSAGGTATGGDLNLTGGSGFSFGAGGTATQSLAGGGTTPVWGVANIVSSAVGAGEPANVGCGTPGVTSSLNSLAGGNGYCVVWEYS